MEIVLEWHGSEVRRVEAVDGVVRVLFSAASAHRGMPDGVGKRDDGFLRPLAMVFTGATAQGDLGSAMGSLSGGTLHHDGQRHLRLPLPFSRRDAIAAELVFQHGTVLRIDADSVSCAPGPDTRFHESMAC